MTYSLVGLPLSIAIYLLIPSRKPRARALTTEEWSKPRPSVRLVRFYDWEKEVN